MSKATRKLEKIAKGFANHRRIEILALLEQRPGLSGFEISDILGVNFKTISEHTRRLAIPGLVSKTNMGAAVEHRITPLGRQVLKFLRTLE